MGCSNSKTERHRVGRGADHEDWLEKYSPAAKTWVRYWTVIKSGRLFFFRSRKTEQPAELAGTIMVVEDPEKAAQMGPSKKGRHEFWVVGTQGQYRVRCRSPYLRISWIKAIKSASAATAAYYAESGKIKKVARRDGAQQPPPQQQARPSSSETDPDSGSPAPLPVAAQKPPAAPPPLGAELAAAADGLEWYAGELDKGSCDWAIRAGGGGAYLIRSSLPRNLFVLTIADPAGRGDAKIGTYKIRIVAKDSLMFANQTFGTLAELVGQLILTPLRSSKGGGELKMDFPAAGLARKISNAPNPEAKAAVASTAAALRPTPRKQTQSGPKHLKEYEHHEFMLSEVRLGGGHYGDVYLGNVHGTETAIKVPKDNPDEPGRAATDMVLEIQLMARIHDAGSHINVIELVGFTHGGQTPEKLPMLALRLCKHGDLKSHCKKNRGMLEDPEWAAHAHRFGSQICAGCQFLEQNHFVHRDLACRNILLGDGLVCKVSDFGLARDVYGGGTGAGEEMYQANAGYVNHTSNPTAYKWTAIEGLQDEVWSTAADIWSFGIVLGELCARGAQPYPSVRGGPQIMLDILNTGKRWEKGNSWPDSLYSIMTKCWLSDPKLRPTFNDVAQMLLGCSSNFVPLPSGAELEEAMGDSEGPKTQVRKKPNSGYSAVDSAEIEDAQNRLSATSGYPGAAVQGADEEYELVTNPIGDGGASSALFLHEVGAEPESENPYVEPSVDQPGIYYATKSEGFDRPANVKQGPGSVVF